jgi:hypothetical protein
LGVPSFHILTSVTIFGCPIRIQQVQKSLPIAVWPRGFLPRAIYVIDTITQTVSRVIIAALEDILGVLSVPLHRR